MLALQIFVVESKILARLAIIDLDNDFNSIPDTIDFGHWSSKATF